MNLSIDLHNSIKHKRVTNFSKQLFDLILKADPNNLELLRLSFPKQVTMVENYRNTGQIEETKCIIKLPEDISEFRKNTANYFGSTEEDVGKNISELGLDENKQHITILAEHIKKILINIQKENGINEETAKRMFECTMFPICLILDQMPKDGRDLILESAREALDDAEFAKKVLNQK